MNNSKMMFLTAVAVAAFSTSSYATLVGPSGAVLALPVAPIGGGSVIDVNTNPVIGLDNTNAVVFTGSETSMVFAGDSNNLLGGLTFLYELSNDSTSIDSFDRVTVAGFDGFLTDVGFLAGPGFSPVVITRSAGGVIGFDFSSVGLGNNDVPPGGTSTFLVIRTDAPLDTAVSLTVIDGGTGSAQSFGPAPEPTSVGVIGIGSLALIRRRRAR